MLILAFAGCLRAQYAYISGSNGVSVLNTVTNTVTAKVVGGLRNYGVAVNAAGTRVYVASQGSNNVLVIDTATNAVTSAVSVASNPTGIAFNPAGTRVYVASQGDSSSAPASTVGTISVIDTSTNAVTATVNVGGPRGGVAVNPAGTLLYATNVNQVSVIDTATNRLTATVNVGTTPVGIAVNPTGTTVYAANQGSGTVSVIDASTNTLVSGFRVGNSPTGIAINPTGTRAYVANQADNSVSVVDTVSNTVIATVNVGTGPVGVAVNPTGTSVYVVNQGNVSVIDSATNTVTATISGVGGSFNVGNFIGGPSISPSITPGGIVNSANSVANASVAPGSLVSVYGVFPVNSAQAKVVPLPFVLSGLSIQFNGIQAPLLYVSSTQANVQVPWELAGKTQVSITASVNGQISGGQSATLAGYAPGIFTVNSGGQGAIVNALTGQIITPSSPAIAGSTFISIYCTGLGSVTNQPLTGSAPSADVLSETITPIVNIGGVPARVLYSGLAPTFAGLYQINVQVPAGAPFGDAIPLLVSIGSATSNAVTVAIHP